ncbi:DUF4249 domain-containing protein [Chitinophaga silvatica]|uniref:DUF4249 domain-containing protein n=1 Tax=Chitinophaga silvatica TaxID=2282649 RepID=A0A3E1YBB3_9BACT|nr:DUF4249 domain-containing protein [Chitinophaga silvatica]RFS22771.1 DUF4249 domain-containing protein [Chitinophaga silvatica]
MWKYFVYALALFFISCEKRIELSLPYEGDRIVVNSLIQPDSLIYLRVTKSTPSNVYNESGFPEIENPEIRLASNDINLPALTKQTINGQTWWVSSSPAELGKRYTATVNAVGLTTVTATDTLPLAPVAEQAGAMRNSNRIQFLLKDRPGVTDYYRIKIAALAPGETIPNWLQFRLDPTFNNNLVDFFTRGNYSSLVMNDERFDGKSVMFVLQTEKPITSGTQLTVEISSLTVTTYQYLNSLYAQLQNGTAVTGVPVRVSSNVINGYGILGGINIKKLTIKVD